MVIKTKVTFFTILLLLVSFPVFAADYYIEYYNYDTGQITRTFPIGASYELIVASQTEDVPSQLPIGIVIKENDNQHAIAIPDNAEQFCRGPDGCSISGPSVVSADYVEVTAVTMSGQVLATDQLGSPPTKKETTVPEAAKSETPVVSAPVSTPDKTLTETTQTTYTAEETTTPPAPIQPRKESFNGPVFTSTSDVEQAAGFLGPISRALLFGLSVAAVLTITVLAVGSLVPSVRDWLREWIIELVMRRRSGSECQIGACRNCKLAGPLKFRVNNQDFDDIKSLLDAVSTLNTFTRGKYKGPTGRTGKKVIKKTKELMEKVFAQTYGIEVIAPLHWQQCKREATPGAPNLWTWQTKDVTIPPLKGCSHLSQKDKWQLAKVKNHKLYGKIYEHAKEYAQKECPAKCQPQAGQSDAKPE